MPEKRLVIESGVVKRRDDRERKQIPSDKVGIFDRCAPFLRQGKQDDNSLEVADFML